MCQHPNIFANVLRSPRKHIKMMHLVFLLLALVCLKTTSAQDINVNVIPDGLSGDGITTRYWDCCKPSCAWADLVPDAPHPVRTCEPDGITTVSPNEQSCCAETGDGNSYTCNDNQPWAVNASLALGFVAASFTGGADFSMCCACLLFDFKGELAGKQMLAQITNTGEPLAQNQFDVEMPGGGVGIYPLGCERQWESIENGWGVDWMDVQTASDCSKLPEVLQAGCLFRFEFMRGVGNPDVSFVQVECPTELTSITGCVLN